MNQLEIKKLIPEWTGKKYIQIINIGAIEIQNDEFRKIYLDRWLSLRDFININDVVVSYQKLLHSNQYDIVNIANGKAVSINEILQYLIDKNIKINTINSNRDEINISIANVDRLSHIVNIDKFLSIFAFLDKEIIKSYK